jgi:molybdopterin converting factor small subunit
MRIVVRLFGDIAQAIGNRHSLELGEGSTVGTLTRELAKKVEQKRQGYLGGYRVGGSELAILVNGRNIDLMDGVATVLREGDDVVILIPTMGG